MKRKNMKTAIATLTALAIFGGSSQRAFAGDREWATAGKVLTGVVAGSVLLKALQPAPVYYQPVTYYSVPVVQAPPPVYVQSAPVYVQSAPVVLSAPPIVMSPRIVYAQPAPIYFAPAPVVSFHVGPGWRHRPPPVYRVRR
jgi:hypothetical protein